MAAAEQQLPCPAENKLLFFLQIKKATKWLQFHIWKGLVSTQKSENVSHLLCEQIKSQIFKSKSCEVLRLYVFWFGSDISTPAASTMWVGADCYQL